MAYLVPALACFPRLFVITKRRRLLVARPRGATALLLQPAAGGPIQFISLFDIGVALAVSATFCCCNGLASIRLGVAINNYRALAGAWTYSSGLFPFVLRVPPFAVCLAQAARMSSSKMLALSPRRTCAWTSWVRTWSRRPLSWACLAGAFRRRSHRLSAFSPACQRAYRHGRRSCAEESGSTR
jgi:hypothetical protein